MNSTLLQLLAFASIAIAIPAIDNGVGTATFGPEKVVTEFATLSGSNVDNLPDNITICSSVTSRGGRIGDVSPFQLLQTNGDTWISIIFIDDENNDRQ